MPCAKSKTKHALVAHEEKDTSIAWAVVFYHYEPEKDLGAGEKRMTIHSVCKKFKGAYKMETRKSIALDHNTLLQLVNGGKSKSLSNEENG
ncbi:hypothetical protein B0H14DRAFT_2399330 [Mycena olivaceomarginata]|nr:hypothetical protein B0H14DRAFT_2399330 [Mycena olivaceomarginata]